MKPETFQTLQALQSRNIETREAQSHMNKTNVLLIGSGGREHAIAWKLAQSPLLNKLFIAPGNAGTSSVGKNVPINGNDFESIRQFVIEQKIDLVVVGPEEPLVRGIHDFFLNDELLRKVPVIGLGGISNATDAIEFLLAGATAIQVGTANFVDPQVCIKILDGIEEYCHRHGIKDVKELIGALES